jgi:MOSC domain-containing protein YiiM
MKSAGNQTGRVAAISVSREKGCAKHNVEEAFLKTEWGIEGDAHAGDWHRQVSLLAQESVDKMRAKGLDVAPGAFGENITTSNIDVPGLKEGDRVFIGDAELQITQIGKECHNPCDIYYRVGDCVMPREGIFGRVIQGGRIRVGDTIRVVVCES